MPQSSVSTAKKARPLLPRPSTMEKRVCGGECRAGRPLSNHQRDVNVRLSWWAHQSVAQSTERNHAQQFEQRSCTLQKTPLIVWINRFLKKENYDMLPAKRNELRMAKIVVFMLATLDTTKRNQTDVDKSIVSLSDPNYRYFIVLNLILEKCKFKNMGHKCLVSYQTLFLSLYVNVHSWNFEKMVCLKYQVWGYWYLSFNVTKTCRSQSAKKSIVWKKCE